MGNWRQELMFQTGQNAPMPPLTGIVTIEQWEARRAAILEAAQDILYGSLPPIPTPQEVQCSMGLQRVVNGYQNSLLTFKAGPNGGITFSALLTRPDSDQPVPVIVGNGDTRWSTTGHDVAPPRGYAVITFNRVDIAPDCKEITGQAHRVFPEYTSNTIGYWAWGHWVINSWLTTQSWADTSKISATGHSRGGKTALCASLYDPRIAIALIAGSGCGGLGLFRGLEGKGKYIERVRGICEAFPYWFKADFNQYGEREADLPIDQHLLRAALAPRACLNTDATGDVWCNNLGTMQGWELSNEVYRLYGKQQHNGIFYRTGGHAHNVIDWTAMLDFCDMVFFNRAAAQDYAHPNAEAFDRPWET